MTKVVTLADFRHRPPPAAAPEPPVFRAALPGWHALAFTVLAGLIAGVILGDLL